MDIKKALVLGATGATGKNITRELVRRKINVRVSSRNRNRLQQAFGDLPVEIYPLNLSDGEAARRAAEGCDLLFHCVGLPAGRFQDHLDLTRNTVAAMRASGAGGLLISSFWSYWPLPGRSVQESDSRRPESEKGIIRRDQEDLFRDSGGAVAILPDFYGPEVDIGLLNPALQAICHGKTANWIGEVDHPRELIFVPDCGFPLVELASHDEAFGQSWNVPGADAATARDLFQLAADHCGTSPRFRTAGPGMLKLLGLFSAQIRAMQEMYPLYRKAPLLDGSKLQRLIGKWPSTPYSEGIPKTIEWLRK